MNAWNSIKNDCGRFVKNERYQETGKEYSTIVQMIVKDDHGKAIAWRSVSSKMTCYHAVCILYLVCILYPLYSLQSAFCTDRQYLFHYFVL